MSNRACVGNFISDIQEPHRTKGKIMNYKIALSAAFVAAAGLTGCDSRDTYRDGQTRTFDQTTGTFQSGATVPGDMSTDAETDADSIDHNATASTNAPVVETKAAVPAQPVNQPTSGTTTEADDLEDDSDLADVDDSGDVYRSDDYSTEDEVLYDDSVVSGSTSEPMDSTKESYTQTDLPGGYAPEDRNLRFGLIGNGTGMGMEDTSSKFMTDNYTLSDPTISSHAHVNTGALSAPTEDQDALKDIKSGTSFDPENYYIEEEEVD